MGSRVDSDVYPTGIANGKTREEINADWIWLTKNLVPVLGNYLIN